VESSSSDIIGGSHYSLYYLVNALDKSIFEPVVGFYENNPMIEKFESIGAHVVVLQGSKSYQLLSKLPSSLRFFNPVRSLLNSMVNFFATACAPALVRLAWLKRNNIQIVHLNNNPFSSDWVIACKILRIPCVSHLRGLRERLGWFQKVIIKNVDAVFCISNAVYNSLVACGCGTRNLKVVHNGVDPDQLKPERSPEEVRHKLGISTSVPVIGMIGNIKRWKGQMVLVKAIAELRKSFPDVICLIVGDIADEGYFEELQREIRANGLEIHVPFAGYSKVVADYINIMDIVVHASIDPEPFGRVIIEAMAMGKPVIGARAGGVPEIIEEPQCGYTFLPGDSKELSKKIKKLMANPVLAADMGKSGRERVDKLFHVTINASKTCAVYKELLKI